MVGAYIGQFKADVAAVLTPACRPNGPISEEFIVYAMHYVAYVAERYTRTRAAGSTSAFELNIGVPPRNHRLVPFLTAGWAYVPKELRQKRGAPKYRRSEPVLMIGYQHMYTTVYKCLTAHGTIIHTEQVSWDMEAPLGIFPDSGASKPASPQEAPAVAAGSLWRQSSGDANEPWRKPTPVKASAPPLGVIRLIKANVYDPTGKPRPKDYILSDTACRRARC